MTAFPVAKGSENSQAAQAHADESEDRSSVCTPKRGEHGPKAGTPGRYSFDRAGLVAYGFAAVAHWALLGWQHGTPNPPP
jgi:hypothetical protein